MKRIINTLLLLSVAIIAMAQTSFVVADKNGNSQLVQSLVFQQQQTADRFSWKSDGLATGDINDLLFIARAKNQLSTANTEDVTKMLEDLSGTDLADAEAIATALKTNPNVEEAYTADGANLIVTTKDEGYHVVYPMYDANYVFVNDDIAASLSKRLNGIKRKQPRKAAGTNGKIAIFNFYDGFDSWYKTQNAIIKAIEKMFEDHDYYVEKYGDGSNGLLFTEGNLKDVVRRSSEYKAIIIMGHGGARWTDVNDYNNQYPDVAKKKRHVIATKQQCYFGTGGNPNNEYVFREEADDKYYYMMDCELEVTGDCILYDGTCFSAPTSGYSTESDVYPNVSQSVVLGWNGFNRMSQAHAALLFYRMLYERFDLKDAITLTFQQDPSYGSFYLVKDSYDEEADRYDRDNSKLFYSKYVGKQKLQGKSSLQKQFTQNASITLDSPGDKTVQDTGDDKMRVSGKLWGNLGDKPNLTIELHPIYGYGTKTVYTAASKPLGADYYMFSVSVPLVSEGIYDIIIRTLDNSSSLSEIIMLKAPQAVIYSGYFRKNCALPVIDDEDSRTPIIYNEKDETVAEITIPAGTSQTYHIDAYPGHTFETPCLDKSVCDVSVSGNTLTVKGLKEGSTIFGVFDVQNRQMAVAEVTVSAGGGGGGDVVAYTSCPDDHHPHLIDLGLPTKWACCNVDASKPEDYGGYYAWGETEEKDYYDYFTYVHRGNHHSIGNDIAGTQYDVAHVKWGGSWVMPNDDQLHELWIDCSFEWTTENGVNGSRVIGPNGASIFIPAAGYREYDNLYSAGEYSSCWSSTPSEQYPEDAMVFDGYGYSTDHREYGLPVRPVVGRSSYYPCPDSNHPHLIDLGLPSGTKWACCNVGASKPEEYGGFFAWGETTVKSYYDWDTYLYGYASNHVPVPQDIGEDIAGTRYDVVTTKWGSPWVMPSQDQFQELIDNCVVQSDNSDSGGRVYRFVGPNGGIIYLPSAGYYYQGENGWEEYKGTYWSSTLGITSNSIAMAFSVGDRSPYDPPYRAVLFFETIDRSCGLPVRPVRKN